MFFSNQCMCFYAIIKLKELTSLKNQGEALYQSCIFSLSKTYSNEFPNNKRLKNNGEHIRYHAENNHSAIIDEEIFEKIQAERSRRTNIEITDEGKKRKSQKYSSKRPNFDKI